MRSRRGWLLLVIRERILVRRLFREEGRVHLGYCKELMTLRTTSALKVAALRLVCIRKHHINEQVPADLHACYSNSKLKASS